MTKLTSFALDLIRLFAAMIVFIGHLSGQRFTGGLFWQVGELMDEAVIIFFVLSGFVISYVVSEKELLFRDYLIARAARMYSVALPAIFLTYTLDRFGIFISPDLYNSSWGYLDAFDLSAVVSGFTFTNQLWYRDIHMGSMLPYWSLGYEVWYYIIFGAIFFARSVQWYIVGVLAILIAGPKIIVLFPLWLIGYFAYKFSLQLSRSSETRSNIALIMIASSFIGFVFYVVFARKGFNIEMPKFISRPTLVRDYSLGLIFSLLLVGISNLQELKGKAIGRFQVYIKWLAGATFSIYLLHMPIAQFLIAIVPPDANIPMRALVLLFTTMLLILLIAEFTERKKHLYARFFSHVFRRW